MESEPVIVDGIMLSDHSIREQGTGKLTLIGIFSAFNAPTLPFPAPLFYVTPFLTNFVPGKEKFSLTIRIEQPDTSHVLASVSGKVNFKKDDIPRDLIIDSTLPVKGATFPEAGIYEAVVFVDDQRLGSRKFRVVSRTAAN